jgi:hypothetical protein
LDLIKRELKDFFLVGGTALSLQIGHRISIDIDLFAEKALMLKNPRSFGVTISAIRCQVKVRILIKDRNSNCDFTQPYIRFQNLRRLEDRAASK